MDSFIHFYVMLSQQNVPFNCLMRFHNVGYNQRHTNKIIQIHTHTDTPSLRLAETQTHAQCTQKNINEQSTTTTL